jgi:hypothetical protein
MVNYFLEALQAFGKINAYISLLLFVIKEPIILYGSKTSIIKIALEASSNKDIAVIPASELPSNPDKLESSDSIEYLT